MIVIATVTEVYLYRKKILAVDFESSSPNSQILTKYFGIAPKLTKIYKEFETGNIIFEITQEYLGAKIVFLIPREEALKKSGLLKYANQGLNVNEANCYYLIDWLRQLEVRSNPPVLIHRGIGFDVAEDYTGELMPVFKAYKGLGMESEYQGKLPITPRGKLDNFRVFCKEHINGTPLSLALALGLSSAIVGFLGEKLQADNLVAHLSGDSSTGKTTAAKLAVSTGSMPSFLEEYSLLNDYDGTENALLATLIGNQGYCCCFDEANMNDSKDFSKFIYRLASGRGKRRLTKEGTQKAIETYLTTVISTGEKNLTKDSNQNTGKEIRVLTFSSVPWTKNAEHAETVNAFIRDNYGWTLFYLAKYLLRLGVDKAMARYEKNRETFLERSLVKDNFTNRLSAKYAFILTAVELANKCMQLELPYDYILDMLLKHEAETMDSRDMALKAYDYLLEQANVNIDKFSLEWRGLSDIDVKSLPYLRDVWGKREPQDEQRAFILDGRRCTTIINFAKGKFEELLRKGNFEEPAVVIKKLKERQLLDHEKDRNTRTKKIAPGGTAIDVYALRVFENPNEEPEVQKKVTPKKPIVSRKRTTKAAKKRARSAAMTEEERQAEEEKFWDEAMQRLEDDLESANHFEREPNPEPVKEPAEDVEPDQ